MQGQNKPKTTNFKSLSKQLIWTQNVSKSKKVLRRTVFLEYAVPFHVMLCSLAYCLYVEKVA